MSSDCLMQVLTSCCRTRWMHSSRFQILSSWRMTGNPHLMPVAPTGVAIRPRSAGFGNRDRFHSSGKIGLRRGGRISSYRRQDNSATLCRKWQHNVAFSDSIPLQPAPQSPWPPSAPSPAKPSATWATNAPSNASSKKLIREFAPKIACQAQKPPNP